MSIISTILIWAYILYLHRKIVRQSVDIEFLEDQAKGNFSMVSDLIDINLQAHEELEHGKFRQ